MPQNRTVRPGDRDLEILDHVMRYRLTTPEVLHRHFFTDSDRNAVTKVTSRLCDGEFLQSHALYASFTYFTLGRQGAKIMGLPAKKVGPLGPQSLYREYGTLAFCCRTNPTRQKFRVREIQQTLPHLLGRKLDCSHYYIDRDGTTERLGYIWVEGGGAIDHIIRTVRDEVIERRKSIPLVNQRISSGSFVVAIVTCYDEKVREIKAALTTVHTQVLFRVEAVPELIHLLPGANHG